VPPRRRPPKLVEIEWEDITPHEGTWVLRTSVKPAPAVMRSVGWLIRADDKYVILAQDYDHADNMVAGLATYPKGCVKTLTEIGVTSNG